jgi:hypothetical protein
MTSDQFDALAELLRLRPGATLDAVRQHLVHGLSLPDAARSMGADYHLAYKAVQRATDGLALARRAAGL